MAAATAIVNTVLKFNEGALMPTVAAIDATNGGLITCDKADQKMLIILTNADASNDEVATIKKGNGIQGVADLAITVTKATTKVVVVESGKYKNISGTNKGKILITGTADVTVACVVLP